MPKRLIKFELEFESKNSMPKFSIKQRDSATIEIDTFLNGVSYNPVGSTCELSVHIAGDTLKQENNIRVQGNKIIIDLDKNIINNPGEAIGELELTDQNGVMTSSSFKFTVDKKIGEGALLPGIVEGFVEKFNRLMKEFKGKVSNTISECKSKIDNELSKLEKDYNTTKDNIVEDVGSKKKELDDKWNTLETSKQQDAEVIGARDGEVTLNDRLNRDLKYDDGKTVKDKIEAIEGLAEFQNLKYSTNKGYIVCENTKNGQIDKMKIRGKTLVNLSNSKRYSSGNGATYEGNIFTLPKTGYVSFICTENTSLQGKTLTIKYHATLEVGEKQLNATIRYIDLQNKLQYIVPYVDENEFKIVVPNVEYKSILIYIQNVKDTVVTQEYKITCVEGDHLESNNKPFEGLKSVGDGVDKLEVLSSNGNLFDMNDVVVNKSSTIKVEIIDDKSLSITRVQAGGGVFGANLPMKVVKGETYTISVIRSHASNVYVYDTMNGVGASTRGELLGSCNSEGVLTFIAKSDGITIGFNALSALGVGEIAIFDNIMFSIGSEPKSFKKHKSHKKQILYYDPDDQTWKKPILREFDYIEQLSDGSYKYHVRTGQYTITGNETIKGNHALASLSLQLVLENIPSDISMSESNNKCLIKADKIPAVPQVEINSNTLLVEAKRGIATRIPGNKGVYIAIEKSICSDTNAGIQWLKNNNITICYPLEQEEVYECVPLRLNSHANENMVQFIGGAINPGLEFEIVSNIGNMVLANRDSINYLEEKYTEKIVTQNRLQLKSMYSADRVTFRVDTTFLSTVRSKQDIDYDVFKLLKDVIKIGANNYDRLEVEEMMDFYLSVGKLDYNMWDELWIIMELQHNPSVEEETPEIS